VISIEAHGGEDDRNSMCSKVTAGRNARWVIVDTAKETSSYKIDYSEFREGSEEARILLK
jgi:hypothetical protein